MLNNSNAKPLKHTKNIVSVSQIQNEPKPVLETKSLLPIIVGDTRHYPPANKEWKNSIYAYNKNTVKSLPALDKMATKTIKSYFNLTNNKKLARSERMRNLIRRRTVKRLFVSKPEIKQTSDKVNITVYTFNREKQFFLRKIYFYDRNMYINKNIYLYKLWLKKNLLAFKETFKDRKSLVNKKLTTLRKFKNKTYIHNIFLKKYLWKKGVKFNKNLHKTALISRPLLRKNLIKKNLIKSIFSRKKKQYLKKHNIIHHLKKNENRKISTNIISKLALNKPFKNYLKNKISRKVRFKLRNFNSVMKVKRTQGGSKRSRFKKINLPYSNFKFKNEIKFFSFKLVSELKYTRKLFQFYFIKYVLYLLDINITSGNSAAINSSTSSPLILQIPDKKRIKIIQFKNKYSHDKLKNLELLNLELLHLLKTVLLNYSLSSLVLKNDNHNLSDPNGRDSPYTVSPFGYSKMDFLYKKFENKYFLIFLGKFFKKEFLYINYYSKFLINQLKFGKFLPGLKLLISKIYSKKVELNIVNLKYPHLNSDIYTDSIATKLKRKIGLLRVLKWSLNLARLPYEYLPYNNKANLNKLQSLKIHKSLNIHDLSPDSSYMQEKKTILNSSGDTLHGILSKLYPYSLVHLVGQKELENTSGKGLGLADPRLLNIDAQQATHNKNLSVLNIIKYKWVSGVRLEAAGRLTRRYTAARSVFKFRYKGSLKNVDYSQKTDISKKNISTVMLRNNVKSNSQYSFTKSKRRIGAFGLKAWIAGY